MKRFLIIIAVLAISVSLFCIPAFAAVGFYNMDLTDGIGFLEGMPLGSYGITLYDVDDVVIGDATITFIGDACYMVDISDVSLEICYSVGDIDVTVADDDPSIYNGSIQFTWLGMPVEDSKSLVASVTEVFTSIGQWVVTSLGSLTEFVWDADAGSLTFVGVLSVCGLAFAVTLLVLFIVLRFFRMR